MEYSELQVTTNFSFLRGASHPNEMVEQAADFGYSKIAITDRNTFAGIVRAHAASRKHDIKIIPGCRLDLLDGPSLLALPTNKNDYEKLSELLTIGNIRAEKGECFLYKKDIYEYKEDLKFIAVDFKMDEVDEYKDVFGKNFYLGATRYYKGDDNKILYKISQLSKRIAAPMIATNDVHYHNPGRRELQDVVTCVREKCTIQTAGFRLYPNAERYLKSKSEMERLFRQYPDAIKMTNEVAEACTFSLDELKYVYPREVTPEGQSPHQYLTDLAWKGAHDIYGEVIPDKIRANIKHELSFMELMNYAHYFLTVYDIVHFARSQGILCQGRGSAANSTVCYCLGITSVDPSKFDLLFERFISSARDEPPDIDVDFEHERREEVIQYIYKKYGRDRAAIVATVTQQHHRGAIRDVGKVMELSVDTINKLSGTIWDFSDDWLEGDMLAEQGFNRNDPTLLKTLQLTGQFMGFPRQLGQHTGGFVITESKLAHLCPILNARMEDRTCIEWNKDDIETLKFLKIDILGLGMLTCIRKAFTLAKDHYQLSLTLANIPQDDPKVYEMISHADTIGVFQIESRAQQSMLPRLRPRNFYDLVIEVAIVRPGPIQGDMVHPYLRRRNGEEKVEYPSPELEEILKRTLGVPLFQEQAMKIAIVGAGFSPAEADELRRSMATFKAKGVVANFERKLIEGMKKKGYTEDYAKRVFRQLEGFGSYGFPESHAASFALLVYVSSWLKCYYPDVFACALLNSMPMGFYQPAQIVIDARRHGVLVAPVDINFSGWDNSIEEKNKLRLGFRQVKGLKEEDLEVLINNRVSSYSSIHDLRKIGIAEAALERLADADAFRSIDLDRRQALWEVSTQERPLPVLPDKQPEEKVSLPQMSLSEHVVQDYASVSLSLKAHPVSFARPDLDRFGIVPASKLGDLKDGSFVKTAGIVLVRQRPGTASGICFITIEDETGNANLVVFKHLFDKFRKEILQSTLLMVEGKLQIEGEVVHVIVSRCHNFNGLLKGEIRSDSRDFK
jgi:error-prone DNA polymerase